VRASDPEHVAGLQLARLSPGLARPFQIWIRGESALLGTAENSKSNNSYRAYFHWLTLIVFSPHHPSTSKSPVRAGRRGCNPERYTTIGAPLLITPRRTAGVQEDVGG